jgi:hypothetical protein
MDWAANSSIRPPPFSTCLVRLSFSTDLIGVDWVEELISIRQKGFLSFSSFGDLVVRWFPLPRSGCRTPARRTGMYMCAGLLRAVQQMADRFLRPSRLSCISLEPISISGLRISRGPSHIYLKKNRKGKTFFFLFLSRTPWFLYLLPLGLCSIKSY